MSTGRACSHEACLGVCLPRHTGRATNKMRITIWKSKDFDDFPEFPQVLQSCFPEFPQVLRTQTCVLAFMSKRLRWWKKFLRGGDNFWVVLQSIYKETQKLNDYEDCTTTYPPVVGYLGELPDAQLVLRLAVPVPRVPSSPSAASPPSSSPPPLTPRTGAASRAWVGAHEITNYST